MHYADFRTLTFQLPRPAGVDSSATPVVLSREFWGNNAGGVDVFTGPGQDTFISFHMNPTPNNGDEGDRSSGELHLRWTGPGTRRSTLPPVKHSLNETSISRLFSKRAENGEPEAILEDLFNSLTVDQKETYHAIFPTPAPPSDDVQQKSVKFLTGKPPPVMTKPPLSFAKNPLQEAQQRAILNSFCGAFGGQLPADHPGPCADLPPFTRLDHTGQSRPSGWYTDPVIITLIAINTNGKGIDHTEYRIGSQSFIRYSSPFPLPQGISTVFYRSQDRAGTVEATRQATFKIDTIPPQGSLIIGLPQYTSGPPVVISSTTSFTFTGTDSGSGVLSVGYRFYIEGAAPNTYTTVTGNSVQFKISGPDGVYEIDTIVTDVAGSSFTQSQKVRLSHVADLAILTLELATPPPPFIVVDAPIQLSVRATVSNLGFVNPVDATLRSTVADTTDVTVAPKDISETVNGLGLNLPQVREDTYTISCQRRSSNTVIFTSDVELSGSPGTEDNDLANNHKFLTVQIVCKVPWQPGVFYHVGDEVVFDGKVYVCRQSHTSQTGWEPPATYALWQRTPVGASEGTVWAAEVIYQTGDVVEFEGHHYMAIQGHQSLDNWTPPSVPALWKQID